MPCGTLCVLCSVNALDSTYNIVILINGISFYCFVFFCFVFLFFCFFFREHAMLAKTAGVKHLVVLVNKMDDPTVEWDEGRLVPKS